MIAPETIREAARLLAAQPRAARTLAALPEALRPATIEDAHAIQTALVELSGGAIAGWKVATNEQGQVMWGAILPEDCLASPATIAAERFPLRGIEGEVAIRFARDLPARRAPYTRAEVEAAVVAFAAIEIVDSRFADYREAPFLDRLADRMSNGGIVIGPDCPGWRVLDLKQLEVSLVINGEIRVAHAGGHNRGDPMLPALEFINAVQLTTDFHRGQFITTGTCTGLAFGEAGQSVKVAFKGLGSAAVTFR
jgi:2-keto-4-pentenoate hydratase